MQPIAEDFLHEEDSICVCQGGAIEGLLGSGRTMDSEDWDIESLVSLFQDPPVIDTGSISVAAVTWEAPREDEESFRDYAARRAASFGYPSLRDGQVGALEKLIEYRRDVMLIAKTSFQNQSENVMKRGAHLGVRCIVLDGESNTRRNREKIGEGKYTHGKHT